MGLKIHGNSRHGMSHSSLHNVWKSMRKRCNNSNDPAYKNYGSRGIKVCSRWDVFEKFLEDMGQSYSAGLTIERIDNNKGYSPENCKWIPKSEQPKNRRNIRLITFNGISQTIADWARDLGMNRSTLSQRFYVYKWDVSRCLERKQ